MAAEDDIVDETSQLSATDSSDDDDSTQDQIETLIAGRERRRTAGNRYDRDMVLEGAGDGEDPDEVALLFADNEQEDDDEFKSGDDDEDADMSSSDDDDQGPNAAADDMEGEKELQKQAKVERARKRKADLALTSVAGLRKKLKTDPTRPAAVTAAPAKPSKKKERVTWVHDPDSGRSSLRKQTIAHRAETIARLKKSEAQSKKMKALKEQRDRERAKDAPKELTQADRLAEAARVERQNAKSLNRWEALEKKRQEEQAAKLAALKNRRLEGPVVSWWSAKGTWVGPKLSKIGTKDAGEIFEVGTEPKKRGRKSKAFLEQQAAEKAAQSAVPPSTATASEPSATPQAKPDVPETAPVEGPSNTPAKADASMPMELDDPKQSREDPAKPDQSAEPDTTLPTEPSTDTPTLPLADHSKTSPPPNNDIETPREDVPPKQTSEQPPPDQETSFLNGIQEYADMHTENNASESRRESPTPKILEEHEKTAAQVPGPGDDDTEQSRPQREKQVPGETASSADTPSTEIKMLSQAPSLETEARPTPGAQDASVLHPTPNIPASGGAPVSTQIQSDPTQAHPQVDPQTSVVKVEEGSTEAPPATAEPPPPPPPRPPPEEPTVEYSTRNIVILESFDELSDDARRDYSLFFNKSVRKMEKRVKHVQELCPITTLPVKYRDPETGIGFANVIGYKKLQDLKQHRYIWSSMLGCYVGREGGQVARGVPEGFVDKT